MTAYQTRSEDSVAICGRQQLQVTEEGEEAPAKASTTDDEWGRRLPRELEGELVMLAALYGGENLYINGAAAGGTRVFADHQWASALAATGMMAAAAC